MSLLTRALAEQLRAPHGLAGRLVAAGMAKANRNVIEQTVRAADIRVDSSVLDLGCGGGEALTLLRAATPKGSLSGLDHSQLMVDRARRRNPTVDIRRGTFEALPYADGSFDRVLAINVAYFWHDASAIAAELIRVVRSGGRIAVYFTAADHLQRFGLADTGTHRMWYAEEMISLFGYSSSAICIEASRSITGHIIIINCP